MGRLLSAVTSKLFAAGLYHNLFTLDMNCACACTPSSRFRDSTFYYVTIHTTIVRTIVTDVLESEACNHCQ